MNTSKLRDLAVFNGAASKNISRLASNWHIFKKTCINCCRINILKKDKWLDAAKILCLFALGNMYIIMYTSIEQSL